MRIVLAVMLVGLTFSHTPVQTWASHGIQVIRVMRPTMEPGGYARRVASDPARGVMYVVRPGPEQPGGVAILNAKTAATISSITLPGYSPEVVAYDRATRRVVVGADQTPRRGGSDAAVFVLSAHPLHILRRIPLGSRTDAAGMLVQDLVISARGSHAFVLTVDGSVISVDLQHNRARDIAAKGHSRDAAGGALTLDDGAGRLVVVTLGGTDIYDADSGALVRALPVQGNLEAGIDVKRHLVMVPDDVGLRVFSMTSGRLIRTVDTVDRGLYLQLETAVLTRRGDAYCFASIIIQGKVTNEERLVVIDYLRGRLVAVLQVASGPSAMVADQATEHVFVTLIPSNQLIMINGPANAIGGILQLHQASKGVSDGLALNPSIHRLFVVGWGTQWIISSR